MAEPPTSLPREPSPAVGAKVKAWCSWCWHFQEHELVYGAKGERLQYRCAYCKSTTAACVSGCHAMAKLGEAFCAFCQGSFHTWDEAKEIASGEKRTHDGMGKETRPPWASDESTAACTKCSCSFSFVKPKHHCRACGLIFCNNCSLKRADLAQVSPVYVKPARICDLCAPTFAANKK